MVREKEWVRSNWNFFNSWWIRNPSRGTTYEIYKQYPGVLGTTHIKRPFTLLRTVVTGGVCCTVIPDPAHPVPWEWYGQFQLILVAWVDGAGATQLPPQSSGNWDPRVVGWCRLTPRMDLALKTAGGEPEYQVITWSTPSEGFDLKGMRADKQGEPPIELKIGLLYNTSDPTPEYLFQNTYPNIDLTACVQLESLWEGDPL